jgi:peptide/nickel transport system permease protein
VHWVSNVVVLLLLLGAAWLAQVVARSRFWRESAVELWRRRRVAIVVVGIFVLIALLDSIAWIGGGEGVAAYQPRSVVDRIFQPETFKEASYSAPFATTSFYGSQPLRHPGAHWLGTDILGRDVVYRALKGVRVALLIGVFASLIVIPLALLFGVAAGYFGRRVDDGVFFVMTVLASVPSLLLLIALIMVLGKGTLQVCVALGVTGWVNFCRIARGETLKLREADYVAAARALGVSDFRIIWRHILPNLAHLVIITFALTFTALVLTEHDPVLSRHRHRRQLGADDRPGAQRAVPHADHLVEPGSGHGHAVHAGAGRQHHRRRHARHRRSAHAQGDAMSAPLLAIDRLAVSFPAEGGRVPVVDRVELEIAAGETLALVGESGCGKSVTALAIMRLVPRPGRIEPGSRIRFEGRDLLALPVTEMRNLRGGEIGMIFQEPMTSLNPVTTVGAQVEEAIRLHATTSAAESRRRTVELFQTVGIPDPASRVDAYPHQLSGGLKQRVMIAMAMAMKPRLLICDEPTTALDATIRAQILELIRDLAATTGTAVLIITHDFGVVNVVADRVAVMYAGQIVEEGTREELLGRPKHPYTQGLLRSIPRPEARGTRLEEIKGAVPRPGHWPAGCRFHPRCPHAFDRCRTEAPVRSAVSATQAAWCHLVEREAAGS